MKVERVVPGLFSIIGLGLLVASVFVYLNTRNFINASAKAQGTVIAHAQGRSSDGDVTYAPVISFRTESGQTVEFKSGTSSTSASPPVGQQVEVLYNPQRPEEAEINSFSSLWALNIILAGLGAGFFIVGTIVFMVFRRASVDSEKAARLRPQQDERLRREGRKLMTKLDAVIRDSSVEVNGRSPYKIITQWHDERTNSVRVFESDPIWFNPEEFIKSERIAVYVEPEDIEMYVMDTSFLPKLHGDDDNFS
ncbi:MAG TPA: DUF3592 domain-containing protein [Pyrinomonadaceae bacterium]|nr:DUF3592 domain-containing protein [Pyrinomonadaceae bacterium]